MDRQDKTTKASALRERLERVERALDAILGELKTRRVVLVDEHSRERLVAETSGGTVELRLLLPMTIPGRSCGVVLYASTGEPDLEPGVGVQLWAEGDARAGGDLVRGPDGAWHAVLFDESAQSHPPDPAE